MPNSPKKRQQPEDNTMAVASLVLGIISVAGAGPLTGIPAVIIGIMALKNPNNKGMAVAGIITGSISIILALLIILFIVIMVAISAFSAANYDQLPIESMDSYDTDSFQQRA